MVVAGANAGVYDLKAMAFETHESMLRAGRQKHFVYMKLDSCSHSSQQARHSFALTSPLNS